MPMLVRPMRVSVKRAFTSTETRAPENADVDLSHSTGSSNITMRQIPGRGATHCLQIGIHRMFGIVAIALTATANDGAPAMGPP